jgi:hypothetical protein
MNNCDNETTTPKVEYKAFPHLFNLVAMRARFKLRSFYNDVTALENKIKKDNDVNKNKKPLDVLLHHKHEERKDNNNNNNKSASTSIDSKVLARYYKKSFIDLYKDECAIASKLIASENKVIDYYNKNNFIQFKHHKYKLKPNSNNASSSSTLLAPISRSNSSIKPSSQCKASTVPPSKVVPALLDNVAHHKRLRTHKSNSLSFFHRYDHLNKSNDDVKQLQGVDKEGNVIDANLAVKPIFKLTTHAMINKGVFRVNMTRNQYSNRSCSSNGGGVIGRKLSEPMEGFNFDYVKFAIYDLGAMLNKGGKVERRHSM